jgi:hypothetical protein
MKQDPPVIDRRKLLGWLAAGAAAPLGEVHAQETRAPAATPPAAASAAPRAVPMGARLRDFVRMRGALDDRVVIGFLSGQYYGVVDDELTPLFGVLSATFSRWRARPEGGYVYASFEQAYYTDPDSGAVLTQWRNPYNGQAGTVPVWSSKPAQRILTQTLSFESDAPMPPATTLEQRVISAEELADELSVVERVRFAARPPAPARPYKYAELVTLRASLAALRDPAAPRVPCTTAFAAISSWRSWLQMGDQPGHLMAHGAGRYGASIDALPRVWLEATQRVRPELLQDPGRSLAGFFKD